jgi:hypothetical protein
MAWNVDQIYKYLLFLLRKNQSGSVSATEFFYAWNSEQNDFFQDLKGRFNARNNGKEGVNTGLIENERIEIKLAPFIKNTTIVLSAGGLANRPADFSYLLAFRVNGKDVRSVNKNQIAAVLDSVIDAPDIAADCYYYTPYELNYKFYPTSIASVEIDYLSSPVDVVWAFTLDAGGRQVYNSAGSTQPMWAQEEIMEVTERTLKKFGISYRDGDIAQYGSSVINTGN